eukprot:1139223-Pelagomonas_calceolata.AAC.1
MQPVLQVFQRTALHPVSRVWRKVISGQSFTHELGPSGVPCFIAVTTCLLKRLTVMQSLEAIQDLSSPTRGGLGVTCTVQVHICLQDLPERLTIRIEQTIVHLDSGFKPVELQWHIPTLSKSCPLTWKFCQLTNEEELHLLEDAVVVLQEEIKYSLSTD